jgi:hypothetical protein
MQEALYRRTGGSLPQRHNREGHRFHPATRPSRDPAGRHGNRRRRTGDAGSAARPDGGANGKTYFFFLGAFLPFLRALESAMAMGGNGAPNHDGWRRIHPIAIVIVGPQERAIAQRTDVPLS